MNKFTLGLLRNDCRYNGEHVVMNLFSNSRPRNKVTQERYTQTHKQH